MPADRLGLHAGTKHGRDGTDWTWSPAISPSWDWHEKEEKSRCSGEVLWINIQLARLAGFPFYHGDM